MYKISSNFFSKLYAMPRPMILFLKEYFKNKPLVGAFKIAMKKLSKFKQVQFIKKTSEEAVKDIAEPLDFVYIDGNHRYEYVKKDIKLYYPLVKSGGVIGGHDYVFWENGVVRAVNEFVRRHGIKSFHTVFPDWWIGKSK